MFNCPVILPYSALFHSNTLGWNVLVKIIIPFESSIIEFLTFLFLVLLLLKVFSVTAFHPRRSGAISYLVLFSSLGKQGSNTFFNIDRNKFRCLLRAIYGIHLLSYSGYEDTHCFRKTNESLLSNWHYRRQKWFFCKCILIYFLMWFSTHSLKKLIQRKLNFPQLSFISIHNILRAFLFLSPIAEKCCNKLF